MTLGEVSRKNVLDYLDWIQVEKDSSISTRNQRLAAIHAFCRYMQYEDVTRLQQWQEVLGVKIKKTAKTTMHYLSLEGIKALLSQIPQDTGRGRRDLIMLNN